MQDIDNSYEKQDNMETEKQKDVKGIKFRTDSEGTRSWDMTSGIRHLTANSKAFDGFIGIVQIGL